MILVHSETLFFEHCSRMEPPCYAEDYVTSIDEAVSTMGLDSVLFKDGHDRLVFRRPQKNSKCRPIVDSEVIVTYPKYCSFNVEGNGFTAVQIGSGNTYTFTEQPQLQVPATIATTSSCTPTPGQTNIQGGTPMVKW